MYDILNNLFMVKIFPAQKKWLFIGQNHNVYAYCVLKQFRYTLFCVFMSSQGPLYEFKEITDFSLKKLILGSFFPWVYPLYCVFMNIITFASEVYSNWISSLPTSHNMVFCFTCIASLEDKEGYAKQFYRKWKLTATYRE